MVFYYAEALIEKNSGRTGFFHTLGNGGFRNSELSTFYTLPQCSNSNSLASSSTLRNAAYICTN
jgi:hypothetical protein